MQKIRICLFLMGFSLLASCGLSPDQIDPGKITSINIIDRNGLSEIISSKERLNSFEQTNFLSPQPYQKVLRVYGREKNGDVRSCITSYHPNGQPKQYLEAVNNRALGQYKEWYPSGQLKIEAMIIGGNADLNTHAEQSWLFDGYNCAWNEEGGIIAKIPYKKGELEGEAIYYHENGSIWKVTPYKKGLPDGVKKVYLNDGSLFQTIEYHHGQKEGPSIRYWKNAQVAYQENHEKNLLIEGFYFDMSGTQISEIHQGEGERAIFGKSGLQELQVYHHGIQEGKIRVFDEVHHLIRIYHKKNGVKEGEEIEYFPKTTQPKLLLSWNQGILNGCMKTWYKNGNLESQREMSENKKNGLLTAWYQNEALMLVEEYENDKLLKGEYYRLGENRPVSNVKKGEGIATLFNPEGTFSRKIAYQEGKPVE